MSLLLKIDSAVRCNISEFPDLQYLDAYHTCGVFATLSFLLINSVSNSRLDDDFYEGVSFNSFFDFVIKNHFRDYVEDAVRKCGCLWDSCVHSALLLVL